MTLDIFITDDESFDVPFDRDWSKSVSLDFRDPHYRKIEEIWRGFGNGQEPLDFLGFWQVEGEKLADLVRCMERAKREVLEYPIAWSTLAIETYPNDKLPKFDVLQRNVIYTTVDSIVELATLALKMGKKLTFIGD